MTEERVLSAIAAEGLAPAATGLAEFYRQHNAEPSLAATANLS